MSTVGTPLTEAKLAKLMPNAMVYRGLCADVDSCRTMGIYDTNSTTKGLPSVTNATDAILEVFIRQGYEVFQRITVWNGLFIAVRTGNQTSWNAWRTISLTPVSS